MEGSSTPLAVQEIGERIKKKVLVVEDFMPERRRIVEMLESFGYEVFVAGNEEEALEMVRVHNPDIVTMDGRLESMKDGIITNQRGLDIAKKIREENLVVKIIMITTNGDSFEDQGLLKDAIWDRPDALKQELKSLLGKKN